MTKRLRSPENYFYRQEKKFISPKEMDLVSDDKMRHIYLKTVSKLYKGASQSVLLNKDIKTEDIGLLCSSGCGEIDPKYPNTLNGLCSYCDKKVCNNCEQICNKCHRGFCINCCIADYNYADTQHICLTCYS